MTISVVQTAKFNATWSGSFGANVTAGNTVFLFAYQYNGTSMGSNSPLFGGSAVTGASKLFDGESAGSGGVYATIWMLPNVSGGAASVALTASGGGTVDGNVGMEAIEVSGLGTSPSLDSASPNPATASGDTQNTSSGATGNIVSSPEIIVGASIGYAGSYTPPSSPWTNASPGSGGYCQAGWQVVTSSGSGYTYATTQPGGIAQWFAGVAAVKGTGGGGTPHTATAALTVTPALAATAARGHYRTAALTVRPAFTVAQQVAHTRHAALAVTPRLAAVPSGGVPKAAAIPAGGSSMLKRRMLEGL